MTTLRHKVLSAAAITAAAFGAFVGASPANAQSASAGQQWQANEDDFLLLQGVEQLGRHQ